MNARAFFSVRFFRSYGVHRTTHLWLGNKNASSGFWVEDVPRHSKGVYLLEAPATGSTESYDTLRSALLSAGNSLPRKQNPHVTIVHPRNGTCSDSMFEEITRELKPFTTTFRCVTLIEQADGGPWQDLFFG